MKSEFLFSHGSPSRNKTNSARESRAVKKVQQKKIVPRAKEPAAERQSGPFAAGASQTRAIGRELLGWYARHKRDLPWRKSLDPYAVWVSEMMLQQTQVATVIPYFRRWMERFPNVSALASADEGEVLHAWQGLGYYSRARNLRRAAQAMVAEHGGRVPDEVAKLRALPGIGPYSAGAIASIAYGRAEPLVDGNVVRVLTRLFALRGDPNKRDVSNRIWALARSLVPSDAPGDFNQALMELGATVCTPQKPRCDVCPLAARCSALAQDLTCVLPELPAREKPTQVHMVAAVVARGERVLVTKLLPNAPRWAGMWLFPHAEVRAHETPEQAVKRAAAESVGLEAEPSGIVCVVRHTVTRFRITLDAYRARATRGAPRALGVAECAWLSPGELPDIAMPKAHRTIAARLLTE